jgi:hypothetical protein
MSKPNIQSNDVSPVTQEEAEAWHREGLDFFVANPQSGDWRVRAVEDRFIPKYLRSDNSGQNSSDYSNYVYPKDTAANGDIMGFGKYKEESIADVIRKHPAYVIWLFNQDVIEFDQELLNLMSSIGIRL